MTLIESVKQFVTQHDLRFEQREDEPLLRLAVAGRHGRFASFVETNDERRTLVVTTLCPVSVPEEHRLAVAELLTRINWRVPFGCFKLDMEDGQVLFRTGIRLGEAEPDTEIITHLVFENWCRSDEHFPALVSVATGTENPENALQRLDRRQKAFDAKSAVAKQAAQAKQFGQRPGGRLGGLMDGSVN